MELHERGDSARPLLKGFAASLLEEVIRADMSMHDAQLDAWHRFVRYKPKGDFINADIVDGIPLQQYLFLEQVTLSFHIRPMAVRNFGKRVQQAWRILRGKSSHYGNSPTACEICDETDPESIAVVVQVSRAKDGTVKATYSAADSDTQALLNNKKNTA